MKRQRTKLRGTGKWIRVVLQVSKQSNPNYKTVLLSSIHEVLERPRGAPTRNGVWIQGWKAPVYICRHELRSVKAPIPVKRVRIQPVKIVRVRKNKVKIKRSRTK